MSYFPFLVRGVKVSICKLSKAVTVLAACLAAFSTVPSGAAAQVRQVNPPEVVGPQLQPYIGRFQAELERYGLTTTSIRSDENFDLRVRLAKGAASITITAELLFAGTTVVSTPVRNKTFFKSSAIDDTTVVASKRFSQDVSRYLVSIGYLSTADAPATKGPIHPHSVMVYFRPPLDRYEELGILSASSAYSWSFSSQSQMNKVVDRLKAQAAEMGANGVLLVGFGSEYGGSINTGSAWVSGNSAYGVGTSVPVMHKAGTAVAIRVFPSKPGAAPVTEDDSGLIRHGGDAGSAGASDEGDRVSDVYEALIKLDDLKNRGLLTEEEFQAQKEKVLASD